MFNKKYGYVVRWHDPLRKFLFPKPPECFRFFKSLKALRKFSVGMPGTKFYAKRFDGKTKWVISDGGKPYKMSGKR